MKYRWLEIIHNTQITQILHKKDERNIYNHENNVLSILSPQW